MPGTSGPPVTRFEVYEAWRTASEACAALRDALYSRGASESAATSYAHAVARVEALRRRLPVATPPLIGPVAPALLVLDRAALEGVERMMYELGALLIDAARVRLQFAPQPLPLPVERAFLDVALALDAGLALGDRIEVAALAAAAHRSLDEARRMVCQWLDDGLIYMPRSRGGPLGLEAVTLLEAARTRSESWNQHTTGSMAALVRPAPEASAATMATGAGAEMAEASASSVSAEEPVEAPAAESSAAPMAAIGDPDSGELAMAAAPPDEPR